MKTNYVMVDCENVQKPAISMLKGEQFRVLLFLGPHNAKLKKAPGIQQLNNRLECIDMKGTGKNALDFHIAYYLGKLVKEDPDGCFHIISKDKGFNPLIQHLQDRQISIGRLKSIEAIPCLRGKTKPAPSPATADEKKILEKVIATLRKKKSARPASPKALRRFIRADCCKGLSDSIINSVLDAFLSSDYARVSENKIQYDGL